MKRLSRWVWSSVVVLLIATTPHAWGASIPEVTKVKDDACLIILPSISKMKVLAKEEGQKQALKEWQSHREWDALYNLWMIESKWDYTADNPKSTAFGIPQILDMPTDTSMYEQIQLGIKYIKHRYGTPTKALAFHNMNGWY
jgi:hypothetical protein